MLLARWGALRGLVLALAALTGIGVALLDPTIALSGQAAFWLILGVGAGLAALVSAWRVRALSLDALIDTQRPPAPRRRSRKNAPEPARWWTGLDTIAGRMLGDGGCLVLIVALIEAIRVAVALAQEGNVWTPELLHALAMTPVSAFIVFLVVVLTAAVLIVGVGGLWRSRARGAAGEAVPPASWWLFAALTAAALGFAGTLAVGLSDTSGTTATGTEAIGQFLFGPLGLAHAWQYAALWLARVGTLATAVAVVGFGIVRARSRRGSSPGGKS